MSEMSFDHMIAQMTPEMYQNFKQAIERRKWPDGRRLSVEQTELCMEAMIKYEMIHDVPSEQCVGYLKHNECASGRATLLPRKLRQNGSTDPACTSHTTNVFREKASKIASTRGPLHKLDICLPVADRPAGYTLRAGDQRVRLNARLGQHIVLRHTGGIYCVECGRTKCKRLGQGHCYFCFLSRAHCDLCMISPETCRYFQGTCRDPVQGEQNCFRPHIVYLENALGFKGWHHVQHQHADALARPAGAIQALLILDVETRQQSGFVEALFKARVSDRTNWRMMLKDKVELLDLVAERNRLLMSLESGLGELRQHFGHDAIQVVDDVAPLAIYYPAFEWPRKIVSLNFDKTPLIEGTLMGSRGSI